MAVRKKIISICALMLVCSALLSGCGAIELKNSIVTSRWNESEMFRLGDAGLSAGSVRVLIMDLKCQKEAEYSEQYGTDFWESEMESGMTYAQYFLENDVTEELAVLCTGVSCADAGGITLTPDVYDEIGDAATEYYESLSAEERSWTGASEKDVEELYEAYYLTEAWIDSLTVDVSDEISEEEARVMEIKQIYTTSEDKAQEVYDQAILGVNFDSLASMYNQSEDYLVYVSRFSRSEAFTDAVFSLADGGTSEIIAENGGYYVCQCVNSYDKEQTAENKALVLEQKKYEIWHEAYLEYLNSNDIAKNKRLWKKLDLKYNESIENHDLFSVYERFFPSEQ